MDDFDDLFSSLFGNLRPKNPFLAYLPTDTRVWLARITAEHNLKKRKENNESP